MAEPKSPPDAPTLADTVERRRPGRREYANPNLIALLRRQQNDARPKVDAPADDLRAVAERDERDDLAPAHGILLSAVIGVLIAGAIMLLLAIFGAR